MTEHFKDAPVTNEPVYLWNVPNWCFLKIPQLSQSVVAPDLTCLKHIAGIKFRTGTYLQSSNG